jgi:hypothetical protein
MEIQQIKSEALAKLNAGDIEHCVATLTINELAALAKSD